MENSGEFAVAMVDHLLDILTKGEHSKAKQQLEEVSISVWCNWSGKWGGSSNSAGYVIKLQLQSKFFGTRFALNFFTELQLFCIGRTVAPRSHSNFLTI